MHKKNKLRCAKNFVAIIALAVAFSACATSKRAVPATPEEVEERAPIIQDEEVGQSNIDLPPEAAHAEGAAAESTEWDPAAKVCLALGPGMARGFAHAGVLEAVLESGLKPYCIVGTEMGSLVGALYALGGSTNNLQWQLFKLKKETYLDFPVFSLKERLASGDKLRAFLRENFGDRRISDAKIPFAVTATEAGSGDATLMRDESLAEAIGASLALPSVFKAHGNFVSGSVSSPLPIKEAFELGATHVIAVDLLGDNFGVPRGGGPPAEIVKQFLVARNLSKLQRNATPYVIAPDLRNFGFTDFERRVEIVSTAKRAAAEALVKIRTAIRAAGEK